MVGAQVRIPETPVVWYVLLFPALFRMDQSQWLLENDDDLTNRFFVLNSLKKLYSFNLNIYLE